MKTDVRQILELAVPVIVTIGERRMSIDDVLALGPGAILDLEKESDQLLELRVNNKVLARGQAVKLGENFGIRIEEVEPTEQRVRALGGG
ncbi:MAG: FliM/FliN family flagellar motor C-terminal domain-containing protein [Planctomycetota bacterium]